MAKWENKIDIGDLIAEPEGQVVETAKKLAERLKGLQKTLVFGPSTNHDYNNELRSELQVIIFDFENSVFDVQDFNRTLDRLYDLGDSALDENGPWGSKLIWVNAFP